MKESREVKKKRNRKKERNKRRYQTYEARIGYYFKKQYSKTKQEL